MVAAFKGRRFPLRAYGGVWAGQLRWGRLTHSRVLGILANPTYAGTYVFGRYHSHRVVEPDGTVRTKTVELPRDEWPVVIHDHHRGYISWDDYLANHARLAANLTNAGARPAREGHALCQGIISCGSCGRPMSTRYHLNGLAAYECSASRADQMATATCRSIAAVTVDDAVAEALLDALNPEEVALALAAADEVCDRRSRTSRAAELAVERARYEAERTERAFHACEPENRLVARSLEARWEDKLAALTEADKALAHARTRRLKVGDGGGEGIGVGSSPILGNGLGACGGAVDEGLEVRRAECSGVSFHWARGLVSSALRARVDHSRSTAAKAVRDMVGSVDRWVGWRSSRGRSRLAPLTWAFSTLRLTNVSDGAHVRAHVSGYVSLAGEPACTGVHPAAAGADAPGAAPQTWRSAVPATVELCPLFDPALDRVGFPLDHPCIERGPLDERGPNGDPPPTCPRWRQLARLAEPVRAVHLVS